MKLQKAEIRTGKKSLEIESEDNHFGSRLFYRVGELEFSGIVGQVGTIALQDVGKSKAKLKFGNEFEIREIEVATDSESEISVECFEADDVGTFFRHVNGGHNAGRDVGARVAISQSAEFDIDGYDDKGGFEAFALCQSIGLVEHLYVAITEIKSGIKTDVEMIAQTEIDKAVNTKAGLKRGLFDKPCFAILGDVTIACESYILEMHPDRKAKVPGAIVGVRTIENFVVELAGIGSEYGSRRTRKSKRQNQYIS